MKLSRWLAAIFIIVITISSLGFLKFQQIQAAIAMAESFPEPSAAVNAITTKKTNYQDSYKVMGQISATQVVDLQNELGGIITQVNFAGGDLVEQGQLLLSLNIAQEKAQLAAARANVKLATSNFARMKKLLSQNKVSQQEYDSADAQLLVTKAEISNLEAMIAKKQILAPFTGIADLQTYQKGQYLAPGTRVTRVVGTESRMWVDFKVAQTKSQLTIGEVVEIKTVGNKNMASVLAKVVAKNGQIDANSRHQEYRAEFNNSNQNFVHNEVVSVEIASPQQQVVLVPSSAVSRNQHGDYLFTLNKDEQGQYRASRIEVTLGHRENDEQLVLSGIESGALIATEGAFKLREGLLVYPTVKSNESDLTAMVAGE